MVGLEVKEVNEGPMPVRPLKGLGLPPEGAGEPWQSLEQGKDRLRFVLVNRREQNRGRQTREEDEGPGLEWEGGRCSDGRRVRTYEMSGSG